MKKMRKITYSGLAFVLGFWPDLAFGQDVNVENEEDVARVLKNIFDFFYYVFFAIAAMSFLYGAYLFLAAGGDPDKVSRAQKVLLYSVIAIVVALFALGLPGLVSNVLSG